MHEVAVAQGIIEACNERAAGARVLHVTLEIGTLACVLPESLRFCFEVATAGTRLAGATLEIIRLPGRCRCRDCGGEVRMDNLFSVCACGSTNLERPEGGEELRVKSMRIEEAA